MAAPSVTERSDPAGPPRRRGTFGRRVAVLVELLRSAARLDRTQSDLLVSTRNAAGVALPLAISAALGHPEWGAVAAIGAMQTAFADRPGPYRLRLMRMTVCALAAGVTGALAVTLGRDDAATLVLLLVVGLAAGLLQALGPSSAQVGVAATVAALVLGHHPADGRQGALTGLLVLIGGLIQVVFAVAAWPLRRHRPERRALAGVYAELAAIARNPPSAAVGPPVGSSLLSVRQTLYGLGHDHGPSVEAYRVLLDEAERIRRELLTLGGLVRRLRASGADDLSRALHDVLHSAGGVLDEVSAALEQPREAQRAVLDEAEAAIERALRVVEAAGASEVGEGTAGEGMAAQPLADAGERQPRLLSELISARLRGLGGQLRAAIDTARTGAGEGRVEEASGTPAYGLVRLRAPMAALRANLTWRSDVLRHAIRLAVFVAGSDLVVRGLGYEHGYWVPLSLAVVLRPDFTSTFERASMRVAGTVIGLLLTTALIHWVPGGVTFGIVLVGLLFLGMRLAGPGNLGLSAIAVSGLVVVLLSLAGQSPHDTVLPRGISTVIGGALALVAVLVGPVWAGAQLPTRIQELLAAYRDYLLAIADPDATNADLRRAGARSRLARSNAQGAVDRARLEPVRGVISVDLADAVLAHSHRFVHAAMSLELARPALLEEGAPAELGEFLHAAADVLAIGGRRIAGERGSEPAPKLRPLHAQLLRAMEADREWLAGHLDLAAAVVDATDRIANSLDTLVFEVRRQARAAGQPTTAGDAAGRDQLSGEPRR